MFCQLFQVVFPYIKEKWKKSYEQFRENTLKPTGYNEVSLNITKNNLLDFPVLYQNESSYFFRDHTLSIKRLNESHVFL